jgi:hypothetical protein
VSNDDKPTCDADQKREGIINALAEAAAQLCEGVNALERRMDAFAESPKAEAEPAEAEPLAHKYT